MASERGDYLDVNNHSLAEWLALLHNPPPEKFFVANMFPTEQHRRDYLASLPTRTGKEIKSLLRRFLVSTGSNAMDEIHARGVVESVKARGEIREHDARLIRFRCSADPDNQYPVWEGIHWVIDLLPQSPRKALEVLDAFFEARWQDMTDNYLTGLFDAKELIRAFYVVGASVGDRPAVTLGSLTWRDFEFLTGHLFSSMGFTVTTTTSSNDDGADVLAERSESGQRDRCVVQAKKWSLKNPVGKAVIRELVGTIDSMKATRGVLVTAGRFTRGAKQLAIEDHRIDLIDRSEFLKLMALHCGSDWHFRVERLLSMAQEKNMQA